MPTHARRLSPVLSSSNRATKPAANRLLRNWILAWGGAFFIALVNATIRETAYKQALGEQRANQIASVALIVLTGAYVAGLQQRWPIPTHRQALAIGASWAAATIALEFALGFLTGSSWEELAANYNLARGRLWPLVPASMVFLPAAARRLLRAGVRR